MDQKTALIKLENILQGMMETTMGRRAFLASMGFLLASCATPAQHRQREGDNSGQGTALTVDDEKQMTQEVLPQMRKDYPPLPNPILQEYISGLGRKLVFSNKLEGNPYNYNFTVVDVDYVNAFALPAGTIFVTAPLIAMTENEAELAGVLGHEVGHVKARHAAERMDSAKREQNKSWLYAAGGGVIGGAVGYGLGRLICPPKDDDCLKKAATYGAVAGAGGGLLIQKYGFMANSREDEMEADRVGFRVAVNGGYQKDHVGKFYSKLLQMEQSAKKNQNTALAAFSDAMSTHPPSQERVQQMNQMAAEQAASSKAIVSTKEFEQARAICQNIAKKKKG